MLQENKLFNATNLKLLACGLMFLDHIHEMFALQGAPIWLTMLGRLVFPIFLFLAADSFYYTRNRKAYLTRLFLASSLMILGTTLVTTIWPNDKIVLINNAFATFFMTGLYIKAIEDIKQGIQAKQTKAIVKGLGLALLPILGAVIFLLAVPVVHQTLPHRLAVWAASFISMIPNILLVEGGFFMVLLGIVFYFFREKRWVQMGALLAISALSFVIDRGSVQWMMGFAVLPMALYNGQKGSGFKSFFYIFYPVHIFALYILATVLFG